jgi:oligopeptide/dipeptide ABC transporter ATP-binding protein
MSEKEDVILRVKDLRISFRTISGRVQAVRGISFNLNKGETLAIVGESGSGKSVTNRAIMGILAKNGFIESGEVLYDGMDLLKISEKEFCRIRGDKIAMIFQDPLSSLNPIIRIGRQLTEATLLKNKANKRDNKQEFNEYLKNLEEQSNKACANDPTKVAENKKRIENLRKFSSLYIKNEPAYRFAHSSLQDAQEDLKDLIFNCTNKVDFDVLELIKECIRFFKESYHPFVVADREKCDGLLKTLLADSKRLVKSKSKDLSELLPTLKALEAICDGVLAEVEPDLFAYAYHQSFVSPELPKGERKAVNEATEKELQDSFGADFEKAAGEALDYSHKCSAEAMGKAITLLKEKRPIFAKDALVKAETKEASKELIAAVRATIDPLALEKDAYSYTFSTALGEALEKYYKAMATNAKETKRFAKEKAKYDRLIAKGKTPDWKPVPANVLSHELLIGGITKAIDNMIEIYEQDLADKDFNVKALTQRILPHLKEKAALSVYNVTKSMAKTMAIKLMKEVGIAEPRKRFKQYPFEFSGGMRQRIVIAIALAANPEILICDEPTTALDVTIQAQILELINKIKRERKLSVIFITHNLGVVANMADKIAVMYAGKIVEFGTVDDIFYESRHPYTWALLSSMPDLETKEKLDAIPGTPPNMIFPPKGDAFAPRNKYALSIDFEQEPPFFRLSPTHYAATWLCDPRAPKVERPKIVEARIQQMKKKYGDEIKAALDKNAHAENEEAYIETAADPKKPYPLDQDADAKKGVAQ